MKLYDILGYFYHGGTKWILVNQDFDGNFIGIDITPKGKIHTLHINVSQVTDLVLINNK